METTRSNKSTGKKKMPRKAQLIELAVEVFAKDGFGAASINDILKQAGLTGPALYRHFSSKQEMLDGICLSAAEDAERTIAEVVARDDLDARGKYDLLLRTRLEFLFSPLGSAYLLVSSQQAHLSEAARKQVNLLQQKFRQLSVDIFHDIRPDLSESDLRLRLFSIQNMLVYTIHQHKGQSILSDEDLSNLLERMAWSIILKG